MVRRRKLAEIQTEIMPHVEFPNNIKLAKSQYTAGEFSRIVLAAAGMELDGSDISVKIIHQFPNNTLQYISKMATPASITGKQRQKKNWSAEDCKRLLSNNTYLEIARKNAEKYPAKTQDCPEQNDTIPYPDNIILNKDYYTIPDITEIIMAAAGVPDGKNARGYSRRKTLKERIKHNLNKIAKQNHATILSTQEYDDGRPIQALYPQAIVQALLDMSKLVDNVDPEIPTFGLNTKLRTAAVSPQPPQTSKKSKPAKKQRQQRAPKLPAKDNCLKDIQLNDDSYTANEIMALVFNAAEIKLSTKTKSGKQRRLCISNHMRKKLNLLAEDDDISAITTPGGRRMTYSKAVVERLIRSDAYAKYILKIQLAMGIKAASHLDTQSKITVENKKLADLVAVLTKHMNNLTLEADEYTLKNMTSILIDAMHMNLEANTNERQIINTLKARIYHHVENKSRTDEISTRRDSCANVPIKHYARDAIYRTIRSRDFIERLAAYLIKSDVRLDIINDGLLTPDEFLDTVRLSQTYYTTDEIIRLITTATGIIFNETTPVTYNDMQTILCDMLGRTTGNDESETDTQHPAYAIMTVLNSIEFRQQLRNADWLYPNEQPILSISVAEQPETIEPTIPEITETDAPEIAEEQPEPETVEPEPERTPIAMLAPVPTPPDTHQDSSANQSEEIKQALRKIMACACDNDCKKCPLLIMRQNDSGYCLRAVLSMRVILD